MTKALMDYTKNEEYEGLINEVKSAISETRFVAEMTIVEGKHKIGQIIVEDSCYKKFGRGNKAFIERLASDVGISRTDLYYCVRFYEKYPELSHAVETLQGGKTMTWRKVRGLLPEGNENDNPCQHKNTFKVEIEQCRDCGFRRKI